MEQRRRRATSKAKLSYPVTVFFDNNAIDQLPKAEPVSRQRLLDLEVDGEVIILMPKGVLDEVDHPNTPDIVKKLAPDVFTISVELNPIEKTRHAALREIFRGNAQSGKHDADADHVFEAEKYQANVFVTSDGRIKEKADIACSQLEVLTLEELLEKLS